MFVCTDCTKSGRFRRLEKRLESAFDQHAATFCNPVGTHIRFSLTSRAFSDFTRYCIGFVSASYILHPRSSATTICTFHEVKVSASVKDSDKEGADISKHCSSETEVCKNDSR